MKAVVLLSGGVDSATCLALAIDFHGAENVVALSISYGQKHIKEKECAKALAKHYGIQLYEVDLSSTMQFSNCSLLKHSTEEIAKGSYAEQQEKCKGTVSTYVPFRNGLMLSSAATLALSLFPNDEVQLYYGAHKDDSAGEAYPDCSEDFISFMDDALVFGSGGKVFLHTPFYQTNKAGVIRMGIELKVPYELTWSCYEGKEKACGKCGTCIDRLNAFKENGKEDPIEYVDSN